MAKRANTFASYITPPLVIPVLAAAIVLARIVQLYW
jgi:hypothetical protein